MDRPLDHKILGELREELERQCQKCLERLAEYAITEASGVTITNHLADVASYAEEQNTALEILRCDNKRLEKIKEAIKRIDKGQYTGICIDCDQPIDIERLRLVPSTKRCSACQKVFERRRKNVSRWVYNR